MSRCYHFKHEHLDLAERIVRTRNDRKERLGIESKRWTKGATDRQIHLQGALGEIGFCELYGFDVDEKSRLSGDGGYDVTLSNGLTIDVKTRTTRKWDLALPDTNLPVSDICVLMWPISDVLEHGVEAVGWTTRVHLASVGEIMNFGYGDRLVMSHDKLFPMKRLERFIISS